MRIKTKKIFSIALAVFVIFSLSARSVWAFDYPDPASAANSGFSAIMSRLGVNENELKYNVENMNESRKKVQPPLVSLTFNPSDPVPGQKVTATATPSYFLNTDKSLYFTWYLEKDGCSKDDSPGTAKRAKCDLDDDGDVDINDYKIEAARILAGNDFDWDKNGDGVPDDDIYSSQTADKGYKAIWGGDDQKEKNNYCYVHDTTSGDDYPITCDHHLFAPDAYIDDSGKIKVAHNGNGDDEFHDTITVGESDNFGLSRDKFWHTNPNAADTAGTGNTDEANVTGLGEDSFTWTYESGDQVGVVVEGISVIPAQTSDSSFKTMWAMVNNKCVSDTDVDNEYPKTSTSDPISTTDPDTGNVTTVTTTTEEFIVDNINDLATIRTRTAKETVITDLNGTTLSDNTAITLTCPNDGSTTIKDPDTGAIVSCKGYDETKTIDNLTLNGISSVKDIKYASDLNKCLYYNMVTPSDGGGEAGKLDVSIAYNPQFPGNDPASYSDSSESDGDILNLTSSVVNGDDPRYLSYEWQVYTSDKANPSSWGSPLLKSQLPDSTQTSGIGADTFSFRMNIGKNIIKKYIKVKLTVMENAGAHQVKEGHADVVIPTSSSTDKIQVFNTNIDNSSLLLSAGGTEMCGSGSGLDKTVCPITKDQIVALKASKGLTDYSWTIDGQPFKYTKCFFSGCDSERQTNQAFFPVLEDVGHQYTVNLTATDIETGEKVDLTKTFEVVEPSVKITSADINLCAPVLLGNYIDVDGKYWPDYSEQNFEALSGTAFKLKADFTGGQPASGNYAWYVDGTPITADNASSYGYKFDDSNNLVLPGKSSGESYNVAISAVYAPDNITKKVLNAYWNVGYGEFYEETVGKSITVNMTDSISGIQGADSGQKKILASVISSTPSYIAFLFRIVLTAALLLFISRFFLSFFSDIKRYEE